MHGSHARHPAVPHPLHHQPPATSSYFSTKSSAPRCPTAIQHPPTNPLPNRQLSLHPPWCRSRLYRWPAAAPQWRATSPGCGGRGRRAAHRCVTYGSRMLACRQLWRGWLRRRCACVAAKHISSASTHPAPPPPDAPHDPEINEGHPAVGQDQQVASVHVWQEAQGQGQGQRAVIEAGRQGKVSRGREAKGGRYVCHAAYVRACAPRPRARAPRTSAPAWKVSQPTTEPNQVLSALISTSSGSTAGVGGLDGGQAEEEWVGGQAAASACVCAARQGMTGPAPAARPPRREGHALPTHLSRG